MNEYCKRVPDPVICLPSICIQEQKKAMQAANLLDLAVLFGQISGMCHG